MKNFRWKTKDGRMLLLSEMTIDHLKNTANYLRRAAKENECAYWGCGSILNGEMAIYAWESAQDEVTELSAYNENVAELMDAEVRRRGKETNDR